MDNNTQRITTQSRKLRRICTILTYSLPIICGLVWTFFNQIYAFAPMMPLPVHVDHSLPGMTRFLAFLTDLIPLGVTIYGLRRLRHLFLLYENGLIFTEENVKCFRSLGRTLITWVALHIASTTLLSIVLTIDNPPGKRVIALMLDSGELSGVFVGVVVLIISWVMDEGRKIQEDQALIV